MTSKTRVEAYLSSASNIQQYWSGTALVISLNTDTQKLATLEQNFDGSSIKKRP